MALAAQVAERAPMMPTMTEKPTEPVRPAPGTGREALLDATLRVVARDGFDGLTYRAVGAESGTTHGLVSYHFGNREALIREAATRASRRAMESVALNAEVDRPEEFLPDLANAVEQDLESHMFQYEITLQSRRRPELGREMHQLYAEYWTMTQRALERMGIDTSPALARVIFAAVDGIVVQHIVTGDAERTDEAMDTLRGLLRSMVTDPVAP